MSSPSWSIDLDQVDSSALVLISLAALALAGGLLFYFGLLGWAIRAVGFVVTRIIGKGFQLWEGLLSWASWPLFLASAFTFLLVGGLFGELIAGLRALCGLAPLLMGTVACLAYMFIDQERYEVERGYKATHNPLKGQGLAADLARYGEQVDVPLLLAATVATVGGFAMLNQGLYETIGQDWFNVGAEQAKYADFLAYALVNLLRIVDVLNVTEAHHFLRATYLHQERSPASLLLAGFRTFFTFVLLQQLFASLRQGNLLAETITDFWSPHKPIHERARNALPQYGDLGIEPLLLSLRSVGSLTREQRDQLPLILTAIGPSVIPALVLALRDPEVQVRTNAAHALARLDALPADAIPLLVACTADLSDALRINAALALKAAPGAATTEAMRRLVEDANVRIRLIAASFLLTVDPGDAKAGAVLLEALSDPSLRIRKAALDLVEALGTGGAAFLEGLKMRDGLEEEGDLRDVLARLIERLGHLEGTTSQPVAG